MTIKVLVLDDEQARLDGPLGIRTLCPSVDVTWVTTPWDFEEVYTKTHFDWVILDRDLQLLGMGSYGREATGEDVLGLIRPDQAVLVWSWNEVAPEMRDSLIQRAERAGFVEASSRIAALPFAQPECRRFLTALEEFAKK